VMADGDLDLDRPLQISKRVGDVMRADPAFARELKSRHIQKAAGPVRAETDRRLPGRLVGSAVLVAVVGCAIWSVITSVLNDSDAGLLIDGAYAQSKQQNPLENARSAVETLINHLRGSICLMGSGKQTVASKQRKWTSQRNTPADWRR
jgi:hypothetical protein